jgi:acetyltransferase
LRGHGAVLVEDPVTMFEAAVLLDHGRKLKSNGIAAALQSGGACTLFAEAAGAHGLQLPEFSVVTKRALRKALPHFASQNNPLDVTGQAAVETDMFCAALDALAKDPAVGLIAFDAFPPRLEGEVPWAGPVLSKVQQLRRETGVMFASVSMAPLAYNDEAAAFARGWKLPFLQGHRAAAGAIRALVDLQAARANAIPQLASHPARARALRKLVGPPGPLDEIRAAALLELYGVKRPKEAVVASPDAAAEAAARLGMPVAVKALAAELPHKAKLGGVRLNLSSAQEVRSAADDVLRAARRAGARAPKVLVQRMVVGTEVLVGAVIDPSFGACITMSPGGSLAEVGEADFVAAPLTPAQARAFVGSQAGRCGLDADLHDLKAAARAVEGIARAAHDLRARLKSLEANPLLVSATGAVAVDALAEVGQPE